MKRIKRTTIEFAYSIFWAMEASLVATAQFKWGEDESTSWQIVSWLMVAFFVVASIFSTVKYYQLIKIEEGQDASP